MPSRPGINIYVDGWNEIKRDLNLPNILGPEWSDALDEAAKLVAAEMRYRIPYNEQRTRRDHGEHARDTIKTKLQAGGHPLWSRVSVSPKVRGKSRRGDPFRVMGALQGSDQYHYRSGSHMGATTRTWWSGSLLAVSSQVKAILSRAMSRIEQRWNRKAA